MHRNSLFDGRRAGRLALAALAAAALAGNASAGPVQITDVNSPYTQDFDTLPSTGSTSFVQGTTLEGWYVQSAPSNLVNNTVPLINRALSGATGNATLAASAGTPPAPNNATANGGFNSLGQANAADRALGGRSGYANVTMVGTTITARAYNLSLKNSTSSVISEVTVNYDGEQWGVGAGSSATRPDGLALYYAFGTGASSPEQGWQAAGSAFNFSAPQLTGSARALDGNAAANRAADLGGTLNVSWDPDEILWLRWIDMWSGNTTLVGEQLVGIDNVSVSFATAPVTAVPEASSVAMMGAGLGALGLVGLRRRRRA